MTDKAKKVLIILLIIIVIVGGIVAYFVSTSEERKQRKKEQDIIDKASSDSNISTDKMRDFKIIDVDKYLELYKGDSLSIVYIGRSSCEFCQTAEPIIKNIMYEYKFDINYLSTDGFDDEDRVNMLNSDKYFKEKQGISTPSILIVKDNSIVDIIEGLADKDSYIKFFKENNII